MASCDISHERCEKKKPDLFVLGSDGAIFTISIKDATTNQFTAKIMGGDVYPPSSPLPPPPPTTYVTALAINSCTSKAYIGGLIYFFNNFPPFTPTNPPYVSGIAIGEVDMVSAVYTGKHFTPTIESKTVTPIALEFVGEGRCKKLYGLFTLEGCTDVILALVDFENSSICPIGPVIYKGCPKTAISLAYDHCNGKTYALVIDGKSSVIYKINLENAKLKYKVKLDGVSLISIHFIENKLYGLDATGTLYFIDIKKKLVALIGTAPPITEVLCGTPFPTLSQYTALSSYIIPSVAKFSTHPGFRVFTGGCLFFPKGFQEDVCICPPEALLSPIGIPVITYSSDPSYSLYRIFLQYDPFNPNNPGATTVGGFLAEPSHNDMTVNFNLYYLPADIKKEYKCLPKKDEKTDDKCGCD